MQPPPQAVPPSVVGPPPAGSPPSMFWSSSPYRRQAPASAPVAAVTCPLQPVTDPFAFSRQAIQNTSLGTSSKSSPAVLPGPVPPAFLQHPGLPLPHPNAGDSSHGPGEPLLRPLSQPRPGASPFPSMLTPSAPPGPEMSGRTEVAAGSEHHVQAQYVPGAGLDTPHGGHPHGSLPGPDRPPSGQSPHSSAAAPTVSPFFSQPHQQMPAQWGPVQGGPQASGPHYRPCPEGLFPNAAPQASSVSHFPVPSGLPQGPDHEQHGPSATGPSAGNGREEAACVQSGNHLASSLDLDGTLGQDVQAGNPRAGWEVRPSPGASKEQVASPALASPFAQGNSPESCLHYPPGARASQALPEVESGALSVFFHGGERENEETLSPENTGAAPQSGVDGFFPGPGLGPPPAHGGAGGICQAVLRGSRGESVPQGGDTQPYFPRPAGAQHGKPPARHTAIDPWGAPAGAGAPDAGGSHYENVENLEFTQNQEVLPSEPPGLDASPTGDQLRHVPLPGPPGPRLSVTGHAGGGGSNLEALDTPPHPVRSDSVSSSYSSKSHRSVSSTARPQDLGTFIQQEAGRPEDEASGGFFKQIDSSPVGGETDETAGSHSYRSSLSQSLTPSPPKPTGIFQTSANSPFEPVKSHLVGVKPVEADRANVVGEARVAPASQKRRPAAAPPDACPGNLEQPPDNMETLLPPQGCPLPLATAAEAGRGLLRPGGLPPETVLPTPEKKPSARAQGTVKCESPATTLWAQNELPDFGGNVLLAPAAPALHVPGKPQLSEVVQPPDEGVPSQPPRRLGCPPPLQRGGGIGASENLENPPKMGEGEALPSQASSGYAGLLSSPPTESLQNQPVLLAPPDQSSNLAQPVHFPASLSNPNEKTQFWREARVGDRSAMSSRAAGGDSGDTVPLSGVPASSLICSPLPNNLAQSNFPQVAGTSEMVSTQPANLLVQPPSHPTPKNLLPEGQKIHDAENTLPEPVNSPAGSTGFVLVSPTNTALVSQSNKANHPSNREETSGALDFTLNRTLENPVRSCSPPHSEDPVSYQHTAPGHPGRLGPGVHNPDHFYPQVTKGAQEQRSLERAQQEPAPSPPRGPRAAPAEPSNPEGPPARGQPQNCTSPAPADPAPQLPARPPQSSSASAVSSSPSQVAAPPDQQWMQPPPLDYYYYRSPYDGYQAQYPAPYPPDPGAAPLYYQDIYGLYEPRYRPYDSAASAYADSYRYPEPERPSSRASHCSDRPSARQGHPEGHSNSKRGWSSQSDYSNYYCGQYDYGEPGRWDRYSYGSRFRDPRPYDRRYWYDTDYDPYRKENYAYADRSERYDDPWRYDPRFTGSFDDDPEPPRDPYGDDTDRRSVHSEHSAQSLRSAHSRHSSFSAHSQQSQVYRSRDVTVGPYEAPPPPGSFHGDYTYDAYVSNFSSTQGFPEYGYPADAGWPAVEQAPSRPTSPEKFSVPHVCARFGPGGQLIKVIPNLPSEGQPALVEVHSMETLLQHVPEQEEMRAFPGPLGKDDTHKVDVINFAQNKATKCLQNENLIDKESANLLWNFIVLLCRQNGTVVGTDIAELLLQDHKTVWLPGKSPNEANLIDFTNEALEQAEEEEESGEAQLSFLTDSQAAAASTQEKETERFRELLLYGRKKDALESAMKNGLWGHALLLASKMDSRTHARVMTRFANSLPINDPLQTVYQLMSGRMPAASTCCGDEKWGDWRPHLAMVLSNLSHNAEVESRTMATMGDTLASKGLLDAAHFCYLMAQVGFGVYTKKSTKLVLIGSNHSLPFLKFATNEAIQRTEAYEYAQSLGAQSDPLPNFQVFKFIYSCRLADMGLATQAFHYCEAVARSVLLRPQSHSPVLIRQLVEVASQLRLFDPQLKEKPEEESCAEPAWLVQLQRVEKQVKEGAVVWSPDTAFPPPCPSTPSSEVGRCDGPGLAPPSDLGTENPLLAPPAPSAEYSGQGVWLLPSALPTPPGQPAFPTRVPLFPVPPPGPAEPGCGLPGSARGFVEPSGPGPAALYPGPGLPPGAPPLQDSEHPLREARIQDSGTVPQDPRGGDSLAERREEDFGGQFDMGPSRTRLDSEAPPGWGSAGPGALQPPSLTSAPEAKSPVQTAKKEAKEPKKGGESWFSWLTARKKRTEAHLPDDTKKSIVWDAKKNRWVDTSEPEEEKKAPPPPPMSLPKAPQAAAPGPGGPPGASVNMFSRKAGGTRARYVDVLNPGGPQRADPALAPADLFAPLAPLPFPAPLFGPNPEAEGAPFSEGPSREGHAPAGGPAVPEASSEPKVVSAAASLPASDPAPCPVDGSQGGEAPSDQPPAGSAPGPAVPFYHPAQFAQASATSGSSRSGRMGQRKYPALR
ncbi:protein transport protein Sec16A isoform X2 [Pteronotus mesoamericanus]|uniref:protein transport protein Sec16A isoform X2 n=1 Tax=Pteronotus mesoamericanus TaxID=1884717 RepID=UPI0023EE0586|nr:protein transport protein Sec16A isoform X2 [Pteronotus parnellii mesoamericanus]